MLDVIGAYNRFKFLGHEFLTWLCFVIETDPSLLQGLDSEFVSLDVGDRIVLENRSGDALERITIKGDKAGLEEGFLALKKGALVTELSLVYISGDKTWQFTLKGESLNISNLRAPLPPGNQGPEDLETLLLNKTFLCDKIFQVFDGLFSHFIKIRLSPDTWQHDAVRHFAAWLGSKQF
jgi:hypothetical protein